MKPLLTVILLAVLRCAAFAQEIYKWEDEKGVIHYGDKPGSSTAVPLEKNDIPYSTTTEGSSPAPSPKEKARKYREPREESEEKAERLPRPSPSLGRPKAWLDRNGRLRLSGTIRNGGKGLCESPAVEVVVFDESGSPDGDFATAAFPNVIARGEEAQFEGEYLTPVGNSLSWDALPRCDSAVGVVYGARKRGTVSLKRHRRLRLR
jgi:hypothetical protein